LGKKTYDGKEKNRGKKTRGKNQKKKGRKNLPGAQKRGKSKKKQPTFVKGGQNQITGSGKKGTRPKSPKTHEGMKPRIVIRSKRQSPHTTLTEGNLRGVARGGIVNYNGQIWGE